MPHSARPSHVFRFRFRYGYCGKRSNLTGRSICLWYYQGPEGLGDLDSPGPTLPRNLGVHRRFGSILPMLGEEKPAI